MSAASIARNVSVNRDSEDQASTTDASKAFPPYPSPTGLEGSNAMQDAIIKLTIQSARNRQYTIPLFGPHGPVRP